MSVAENLRAVRAQLADAAARAGRDPGSIQLIGVTSTFKGVALSAVIEAVEAGLRDCGENRVQEAAAKIPLVEQAVAQPPRWHLIGHLQSNKARSAASLFATIHSVDSVAIAQRLDRVAPRPLDVYLEVQFVQHPQRFGFTPESVAEGYRSIQALANLNVIGLMTVAPLGLDPKGTRAVFRRLRELRDAIEADHGPPQPLGLSMGMSDDYMIAVEEGSTCVRIGRAIFGNP